MLTTPLGLIADIHGEPDSLIRALDILQGQGVEEIICAGDLVEKGPHSDEVVSIIREREIVCVLGNHDEHALSSSGRDCSPESKEYLASLPISYSLNRNGQSISLTHGVPGNNSTYLFSYSRPNMFRTALKNADTDILILGHTHEPMMIELPEGWIFNPGGVCHQYTWGSGTCALLTFPQVGFKVFDLQTGKSTRFEYVEL